MSGVAQRLLLDCPERIRRLVLVAPGGLGSEITLALRLASLPGVVELLGQRFMAFGTRLALRKARAGLSERDLDELGAMNGIPGSARAFARTVRDVIDWRGQRRTFFERAHELGVMPPIAVCWGDSDSIIPVAHGAAFAQAVEGVVFKRSRRSCRRFPEIALPFRRVAARLRSARQARFMHSSMTNEECMLAPQTSPKEHSISRAHGLGERHLAPGDVVAHKFRLERLLDEGGMGSVWVAHNVDLDVRVALKLLRPDVVQACARDRMMREARVEARLEHRAIVRVFDCGETEDGVPFIAMELLEGMCLADALEKNGPMRAIEAVRTLLPIIDGLGAAHEQGIVHRDVKPANIFLARGPQGLKPKIVDFGIATSGGWANGPQITLEGTVMGSPAYMAPEQARGLSDVDHRADIWAISAVLYEAVTNSPPFHGESFDALLRSIIRDEVTPSRGPEIRGLWPILTRGLDKNRERRFQSMRQLGTALAQFLLDRGVTDDATGESLVRAWSHDGASTSHEIPAARRPSPRPSIAHMPSRHDLTPARRSLPASDEGLWREHSVPPVSKSPRVTGADASGPPSAARLLRLSVAALVMALAALFVVALRRNGDPVPNAQAAPADVAQTSTVSRRGPSTAAARGVLATNPDHASVSAASPPVVTATRLPVPSVTPVAAPVPVATHPAAHATHRDASASLGLKAPY